MKATAILIPIPKDDWLLLHTANCPLLGLPLMLLGICNSLSIHPASHLHWWTLSSRHMHFKQDLACLYTPIPLLSLSSMNLRNWSWGDHPLVSLILLRHLSITSCDYSPLLISRCVNHLMLSFCFLTYPISQIGYILPSEKNLQHSLLCLLLCLFLPKPRLIVLLHLLYTLGHT